MSPNNEHAGSNSATRTRVRERTSSRQAAIAAKAAPGSSRKSNRPDAAFKRLHGLIVDALEDMKARDVHAIDVRGRSDVTDLLLIASGTSSRHVRSIADEVTQKVKEAGFRPLGVEGEAEGEWVLVDLGDIVVHVMQPQTREFYGLERLWDVGAPALDEAVGRTS